LLNKVLGLVKITKNQIIPSKEKEASLFFRKTNLYKGGWAKEAVDKGEE